MNCPQCGENCRCQSKIPPAAPPRWVADETCATPASSPVCPDAEIIPEAYQASASVQEPVAGIASVEGPAIPEDNPDAWRGELATRLDRYRARRKPRPPRYPSLRFHSEDAPPNFTPRSFTQKNQPQPPRVFETASHQALALDSLTEVNADAALEECETPQDRERRSQPAPQSSDAPAQKNPSSASEARSWAAKRLGGKLIEFPRYAGMAPPTPLNELAEPVQVRPRILEAPDLAPPPPSLGGITIEETEQREIEKCPGIDFPLHSAPLGRRLAAGAIDGLVVAAASVLFAGIFWKTTALHPPLLQVFGLVIGLSCLFFACYQYLLIVYSASTPGLKLAGLELTRFDGAPASRRTRHWRVLASYLSALSLGMGYVWLLLDEDALCWHDRITHTYLARMNPKPAANKN